MSGSLFTETQCRSISDQYERHCYHDSTQLPASDSSECILVTLLDHHVATC